MPSIHFGSGSFKKELWIKQKTVFKRPIGADVEFATSGAFEWLFADETGKIVKTQPHDNAHAGWTSVDFSSQGLFGDYSIGFRNKSSSELSIKQGDVRITG